MMDEQGTFANLVSEHVFENDSETHIEGDKSEVNEGHTQAKQTSAAATAELVQSGMWFLLLSF